ncbi:MAG: TIGR03067 domain-containing protein [Planctomycetes bacterium]|nr:TIGR03067 domain-containing protein [Planctomycetota bacterium]
MKYLFPICIAVVASLSACSGGDHEVLYHIQGNWKPVTAELAGQPLPEAVLKTISLKLEKGNYDVLAGGKPDKGTYTIDLSTNPWSMSVTGTEGPNVGKTFPAIFEFNGGTLRVCYDLSGAMRPTEFKSLKDTKLYLVTYKRP